MHVLGQWWLHCTVSGGGRCLWVRMCTVWPSHSKWLVSRSTNLYQTLHKFVETIWLQLQRPQLWAMVIGSFIMTMCQLMQQISCRVFLQNIKSPGDSDPLQPRFGALWLQAFPQTKITFEREEISDHWWDSGEDVGAADGNWETCVRS